MAGGLHFEETLNRHNSGTFQQIAMKFSTMTHFNPVKPNMIKI